MQPGSSSWKGPLLHLTVSSFLHLKNVLYFSVKRKIYVPFHSFNTYEDDVQNELFVGTNILGEKNTQPSILYTVYEENLF